MLSHGAVKLRAMFCFRRLTQLCLALALGCTFTETLRAQQLGERIDEKELRLWADRGEADSQFDLGIRLITGEGVRKNEKEGVEWVTKAANQDHLRAQHVLGSLYEEGVGVKKDDAKALEWYRKAGNNGFPMAQHSLGISYDTGKGVTKDEKESAQWFRKAANQDYPPSIAAYASKLERGSGVEKNTTKAAEYYLRSAQAGFIPAMTHLAYLYYTGVGVPLDYRRAGAWYRRAARSGEPWATNDLAWFLSTCPDENFHDAETALDLAKAAVKLIAEESGEQRHEMVDTLAAALARTGDYAGAALWQKKAIALCAEDKDLKPEDRAKLDKEFADRLKLYESKAPYSEKEPKAEEGVKPLTGDTILQDERQPDKKSKPQKKPGDKGDGTVVMAR